jgi:hypothetical protein
VRRQAPFRATGARGPRRYCHPPPLPQYAGQRAIAEPDQKRTKAAQVAEKSEHRRHRRPSRHTVTGPHPAAARVRQTRSQVRNCSAATPPTSRHVAINPPPTADRLAHRPSACAAPAATSAAATTNIPITRRITFTIITLLHCHYGIPKPAPRRKRATPRPARRGIRNLDAHRKNRRSSQQSSCRQAASISELSSSERDRSFNRCHHDIRLRQTRIFSYRLASRSGAAVGEGKLPRGP